MTEENNEMVDLLKELVGRIKKTENTVYNNDNINPISRCFDCVFYFTLGWINKV